MNQYSNGGEKTSWFKENINRIKNTCLCFEVGNVTLKACDVQYSSSGSSLLWGAMDWEFDVMEKNVL